MVAIKVARQVGRVSPAPAALPGETVTCVARLLLTEPALTTTHRGRNDSARRPVGVAVQLGPQTTTSANPSSSSRPRCLEVVDMGVSYLIASLFRIAQFSAQIQLADANLQLQQQSLDVSSGHLDTSIIVIL